VGKINDKMRKSRENITNDVEPISQEVINKMHDSWEGVVTEVAHQHDWQLVTEWETIKGYFSKFACHCGAVKRVKQFEVEE
jgi:hypothetical protein